MRRLHALLPRLGARLGARAADRARGFPTSQHADMRKTWMAVGMDKAVLLARGLREWERRELEPATSKREGCALGATVLHGKMRKSSVSRECTRMRMASQMHQHGVPGSSRPIETSLRLLI